MQADLLQGIYSESLQPRPLYYIHKLFHIISLIKLYCYWKV